MSSRVKPDVQSLTPDFLLGRLNDDLPAATHYRVAFSGGLDSSVLLNLLVMMRARLRAPLSAIHINHRLQAQSAAWSEHCRRECQRLGIPLTTLEVDAVHRPGESPEAAARVARYNALAEAIGPEEMLLTAHHRDDQAETLLLQLLRGAGVEGLAAMPLVRAWAGGWHARPLLAASRAAIHDWAVAHRLLWVDDPSNAGLAADRNYLRHRVMPALTERWPGAVQNIARSAAHCADAAAMIRDQAALDLAQIPGSSADRLPVAALRGLPDARARSVLRLWLQRLGAAPLPAARLQEALSQLYTARADAQVCIAWQGLTLRRYRDEVWLVAEHRCAPPAADLDWDGGPLLLGPGLGLVRRRLAPGGIAPQLWEHGRVQLGFRRAGLCCRPAGRVGRRSFKDLAQECGIPPWLRDRVPLVLIDGELAGVANCCTCDPFAASVGTLGWVIEWSPAPPGEGWGEGAESNGFD